MPAASDELLRNYITILNAARASDDGERCLVAPHPDLRERIKQEVASLRTTLGGAASLLAQRPEPQRPGFNDGMIIPPDAFPLGTPLSVIRSAASDRAPLRGGVRVIVVLVDFSDKQMTQTQQHYRDLFFSTGVIATKSVREYYTEVTHGLIDIQGDVVGPYRMPLTLAQYAHGASGTGGTTPNAQTMARDAVIAADPNVNFDPYDNDGNGYVDAFIVIHAGPGGEVTGSTGDIWSHKWTLDGGARTVDHTKVFGYLTVPEDALIGVCCHELGHLLFGFPDLYDTDYTSEGIGNWCLMAGGSWGGGGNTPCHPSAWCKANQGWASVDNRTTNAMVSIADVKDSNTVFRLWKDGSPGSEYFLVENRQQKGFDASLPGPGLLIWHIDESIAGNTNENHYKVALVQADGKRDLEHNVNRGDAGDPFPGSANNSAFTRTSTPNSQSYANVDTCVAVTGISTPAAVMTATLQVKCKAVIKEKERAKDIKDIRKEVAKETKELRKDVLDKPPSIEKPIEKPVTDKSAATDKGLVDKRTDKLGEGGKTTEGRPGAPGFGGGTSAGLDARVAELEARLSAVEAVLDQMGTAPGQGQAFIGSDLRPDLSQGALMGEDDLASLRNEMQAGSPQAKRTYDTKNRES